MNMHSVINIIVKTNYFITLEYYEYMTRVAIIIVRSIKTFELLIVLYTTWNF